MAFTSVGPLMQENLRIQQKASTYRRRQPAVRLSLSWTIIGGMSKQVCCIGPVDLFGLLVIIDT